MTNSHLVGSIEQCIWTLESTVHCTASAQRNLYFTVNIFYTIEETQMINSKNIPSCHLVALADTQATISLHVVVDLTAAEMS